MTAALRNVTRRTARTPYPCHVTFGAVLLAMSLLAAARAEGQAVVVRGTVWDSTAAGPLAGARVFLQGTADTVVTDGEGAFSLQHAMGGRYGVSFTHPRLDSLGYVPEPTLVGLADGAPAAVRLAIPSIGAVRRSLCPEHAADDSAVVVGSVVRPRGGSVQNLEVRFAWDDHIAVMDRGSNVHVESAAAGAVTDAAGRFVVFAVPLGVPLRAIVRVDGHDRVAGRLRVSEPIPHRFDIRTR